MGSTKKNAGPSRSYRGGDITLDELRAVAKSTLKGKFAGGSVQKVVSRMLKLDEPAVDFCVHEGDLRLADFSTGKKPFLGLLIVRGNLVVDGLFHSSLDPDSAIVVIGDLSAERMINGGFLEVHGSVKVAREALWLDNDACAEIFGDLSAQVLYTQYQAVNVHGHVRGELIFGDAPRFKSPHKYTFVVQDDEKHKDMLVKRLPKKALELAGDPKDGEDEWCIDAIDAEVLQKMVRAGTPILK